MRREVPMASAPAPPCQRVPPRCSAAGEVSGGMPSFFSALRAQRSNREKPALLLMQKAAPVTAQMRRVFPRQMRCFTSESAPAREYATIAVPRYFFEMEVVARERATGICSYTCRLRRPSSSAFVVYETSQTVVYVVCCFTWRCSHTEAEGECCPCHACRSSVENEVLSKGLACPSVPTEVPICLRGVEGLSMDMRFESWSLYG